MKTIDLLNKAFSAQKFEQSHSYVHELETYRQIASHYAQIEQSIAVLSDLRMNQSYIYYGKFARNLGIDKEKQEEQVHSIWEDELFQRIHPDDLPQKYLQELYFFQYIKQKPKAMRTDYYLASKLRMKDACGVYHPVLHRIFYTFLDVSNHLWLALCLYNPLHWPFPVQGAIISSVNGQWQELSKQDYQHVLSVREKQVLSLIHEGMSSKEIARTLSVSLNTINHHRQEVLHKLKAKNSIEACRIAKELGLI